MNYHIRWISWTEAAVNFIICFPNLFCFRSQSEFGQWNFVQGFADFSTKSTKTTTATTPSARKWWVQIVLHITSFELISCMQRPICYMRYLFFVGMLCGAIQSIIDFQFWFYWYVRTAKVMSRDCTRRNAAQNLISLPHAHRHETTTHSVIHPIGLIPWYYALCSVPCTMERTRNGFNFSLSLLMILRILGNLLRIAKQWCETFPFVFVAHPVRPCHPPTTTTPSSE